MHTPRDVGNNVIVMTNDSRPDAEQGLVAQVTERAQELRTLLDDFSDRLRRMRQRNRELLEEIESFASDLDQLRRRLDQDLKPDASAP